VRTGENEDEISYCELSRAKARAVGDSDCRHARHELGTVVLSQTTDKATQTDAGGTIALPTVDVTASQSGNVR
jgi:hypothetical protein